ncbi:hypothetical protein RRG08_018178 [Elysia crispata]|uniref:Uncharacterized protein n=1 Tax=Elysia crispata TaxID=231223 RepID=A0AAE0ZYQ6_9GAST|nr:hypothetical protein RRG08_018178 [Elysia crispata]
MHSSGGAPRQVVWGPTAVWSNKPVVGVTFQGRMLLVKKNLFSSILITGVAIMLASSRMPDSWQATTSGFGIPCVTLFRKLPLVEDVCPEMPF